MQPKDRTKYADQLNSTILPSNLPLDVNNDNLMLLLEEIEKIKPVSLFRFRKCNERNLAAFDNDDLFFSRANCMNDGFDSRIFVDINKVKQWTDQLVLLIS